jgi:hypothetical protein
MIKLPFELSEIGVIKDQHGEVVAIFRPSLPGDPPPSAHICGVPVIVTENPVTAATCSQEPPDICMVEVRLSRRQTNRRSLVLEAIDAWRENQRLFQQ